MDAMLNAGSKIISNLTAKIKLKSTPRMGNCIRFLGKDKDNHKDCT